MFVWHALNTFSPVFHLLLQGDLESIYASHSALARQDASIKHSEPCLTNAYGLVLGFSPHRMTKRGDWMVSVTLVDESLPVSPEVLYDEDQENEVCDETGRPSLPMPCIQINIFTKQRKELPALRSMGDVLRMHRVKVQRWNDEMQLLGMRGSSFLVARNIRPDHAEPQSSDDFEFHYPSQGEMTLLENDISRIRALWKFGSGRIFHFPTMNTDPLWRIGDLLTNTQMDLPLGPPQEGGDMTVLVTSIIPVDKSKGGSSARQLPAGFLRVWDGTGTPRSDPYPIPQSDSNRNPFDKGDPPTDVLIKFASTVELLQESDPTNNWKVTSPPKALTGRVVNVAVWETQAWEVVMQNVTVGSFLRLRNVKDESLPQSSLRVISVAPHSCITPIPDLCFEVKELIELHHSRVLQKHPFNPLSGLLPLPGNVIEEATEDAMSGMTPSERIVMGANIVSNDQSLESFLSDPYEDTFAGSLSVVDYIPSLDYLSTHGLEHICQPCHDGEPLSYAFGVQLKDPVGTTINVVVLYDEVGEALVGLKASDVLTQKQLAIRNLKALRQQHDKLWKVSIRAGLFRGERHFWLKSLEEE